MKRDISHNDNPKNFSQINNEILKKIKKDSQIYNVYIYLRDVENLTVKKSIELWGYYYLPVAINRLRKHGADIKDVNVENGTGKYKKSRLKIYAEYKLVKD